MLFSSIYTSLQSRGQAGEQLQTLTSLPHIRALAYNIQTLTPQVELQWDDDLSRQFTARTTRALLHCCFRDLVQHIHISFLQHFVETSISIKVKITNCIKTEKKEVKRWLQDSIKTKLYQVLDLDRTCLWTVLFQSFFPKDHFSGSCC